MRILTPRTRPTSPECANLGGMATFWVVAMGSDWAYPSEISDVENEGEAVEALYSVEFWEEVAISDVCSCTFLVADNPDGIGAKWIRLTWALSREWEEVEG